MISEPFDHSRDLSHIPGCRSYRLSSWSFTELTASQRVTARLWGRAKGTSGSVSITVNRHEELSDRSAPYADFGHGSLFEGAPGARQFCGATELSARFLFKPFLICKQHSGLLAHIEGREAIPSTAASGSAKTSGPVSNKHYQLPGPGGMAWRSLTSCFSLHRDTGTPNRHENSIY